MQRFLYGVTSDDAMAGYFQDSCDAVDLAYPLTAYWPDALTQDSLVSLDGAASPYETRNGFFADPEADACPALNYFQKLLILTDGNARRGEESAPDA